MARSCTLKVTTANVVEAAREHSSKCMLAQAIKDIGGTYPTVTADTISFNRKGIRYSWPLPAKAAKELIAFDEGNRVLPFVLHLSAAACMTRPVREVTPEEEAARKKAALARKRTPLLNGARAINRHKGKRIHRGIKRVNGLRVIEG